MNATILAPEPPPATENPKITRRLRSLAAGLTQDCDLQKDLMQEMRLHLLRMENEVPGRTTSWYIKSCQFRARQYLSRGRSVDSLKRQKNLVSLSRGNPADDGDWRFGLCPDPADPTEMYGELINRDILGLIGPQLTARQQEILQLLMRGFRLREIARELRVSHPAVVRHRQKIARSAARLFVDTGSRAAVGA